MFLLDRERNRAVAVKKVGQGWSSSVDFFSPKGHSRVELQAPSIEGSTVRLATDLATLRSSGDDVDWLVRTSYPAPGEESATVDEIAERRFSADGIERSDPVRPTYDVKPPDVDWGGLEKWRPSTPVIPSDLPEGWTFLGATVLKEGDDDGQPLVQCDRIVLSYGIPPREPKVELFQAHPTCLRHATPFENVVSELPRCDLTVGGLSGWVHTISRTPWTLCRAACE